MHISNNHTVLEKMETANMVDIEQSKIPESSFIQWINKVSRIKKALFLSFIILIVTSCLRPSPFIQKGISFYLTVPLVGQAELY